MRAKLNSQVSYCQLKLNVLEATDSLKQQLMRKIQRARQYTQSFVNFQEAELAQFMNKDKIQDQQFPHYDSQINYKNEFWQIFLRNQIIISLIEETRQQTTFLHQTIEQIQKLENECLKLIKSQSRKKNRRLAVQIQKKHICLYEKCKKVYGSEVSLNLHMKIKHDGGNKSERQKLAHEICLAQINHKQLPQMTLTFPPGYLEAFRKYYYDQNFRQKQFEVFQS